MYSTNQTIVEVINISNEIDRETHCGITDQMSKQCIWSQIWINNKFLTNKTMQNMTITDRNNPNTIINILFTFTRNLIILMHTDLDFGKNMALQYKRN